MRGESDARARRLYLASRGLVATHYRRRLTLAVLARTLCTSPRQIQRAYERFGVRTFQEDLRACRLAAAATLLYEQPAIRVADGHADGLGSKVEADERTARRQMRGGRLE